MGASLYRKYIRQICLIGPICILLCICTAALAQEDIVSAYNQALDAIAKKDHEKALALCNKIIADYGTVDEGKEVFGPVYGHWFYMRGLAKIGKKDYETASTDFEICYNCAYERPIIEGKAGIITVKRCKTCGGFGNVTSGISKDLICPGCNGNGRPGGIGGPPANANNKDSPHSRPNMFRMHALVQWGNCQMVLENYANAKTLYGKALSIDRAKRLSYNWKLYTAVNLGRCKIKSGQVEEGYNYIGRALDAERFPLPIKQVVFQVLADDWSPLVDPENAVSFVDQYRDIPLNANPEERVKRNPNFYYLADDAMKKGDPVLALSWYRLIAHPGEAIAKLNQKIELYQARKKSDKRTEIIPLLDAEIEKATASRDLMSDNFWSMQAGVGMAHFTLKNYAASFSVFSSLADFAPKDHKGRPEFLHNAVFSAVQIDDWKSAHRYGMTFIKEFAKHELKPAVVRVLVEMIFVEGDYQKAYDIAKEVRVDMETGAEMREIPDFVIGASAYQLGKYDEAETELTAYLATYDPAQRKELAQFFLGSVKVKKSNWQAASDIFDPFLKEFPQSSMTSSILYQNGLCKFMLNDNESTLVLVDRLLQEFPNAQQAPGASNLRGDVQSLEEADFESEVSPAYSNAIKTSANFSGQEEIAAYAMWQLMMNLAGLERSEEAGKWFDRFQQEHPDSAYSVDMLLGALGTLVALDRTDEAVDRVEALLYKTGANAVGGQLSELFGTYLDFIKENDPENAQSRLDELVLSDKSSVPLQAWAKIGKIQLLEAAEGDNEEAIQSIFYQLNNKFDPAQHSNYVIVRLARWHTLTRKKPQEAAPLYDYILANREGSEDFDLALLDRAEIDAQSELPEDRARAMQYFDRVLNEFANADLAENASVGVSRLLMKDKQFEQALTRWEAYMDNNKWNKFSAEANYNYGVCLDRIGKTGEALVVYINTYNAYPGYVDFSTPSYLRAALIMKEKGEDLKAMLILKDMISRMRDIEHPNKKKALQLFRACPTGWITDQ